VPPASRKQLQEGWREKTSRSPAFRRRLARAAVSVLTLAAVVVAVPAAASGPGKPGKELWQDVPGKPAATKGTAKAVVKADKARAVTLSRSGMKSMLAGAPREQVGAEQSGLVVALPAPNGDFERFELVESPIMEAGSPRRIPRSGRTAAGRSTPRRRRSART
jgi:hypothetical protein